MWLCDLTEEMLKFIYCNPMDCGFKDRNKPFLKKFVDPSIIALLAG